jgi:dTDP-glucose pyrophosphorylase
MKGPILVVLAAGMGSRYGGLKQMDGIGPGGETLLDYSVYDAKRAGFAKVVFIIRRDIEGDFRELVLSRVGKHIAWELAFQELDSIVPPETLEQSRIIGRTKPWGTAHALLCAREGIDAPFTVLNADDFYGREAFAAMGKYLADSAHTDGAIVPFRLEKTLSPQGTVTRGVCEIAGGYLVSVHELKAIEKAEGRIFNTGPEGERQYLAPDTPVSMNFWGFPAGIFPQLQSYFDEFLKTANEDPKSECYLPLAADRFIKNGSLRIRSLDADSEWFGVTYREDRESAAKRIAELVAQGVYPAPLWG